MSAGKKKLGRPSKDEPKRPDMRILTIRLDDECEAALDLLKNRVESEVVRGREAVAVRRAILVAAGTARANSKTSK